MSETYEDDTGDGGNDVDGTENKPRRKRKRKRKVPAVSPSEKASQ
jgi:hypothetical protein